MKIAIMMRPIDHDSGFHLYVEGLTEALLKMDNEHKYILIYQTPKWFGRFSSYERATEILVKAPKIIWDQIVSPFIAWREGADIIFNPKFTVPLISHCPVTMGLQEPGWWVWPEHYGKINGFYQRNMLQVYTRRASRLFPMAHWVVEANRKYIHIPFKNATVAYPGVQEHLKPVTDFSILKEFKAKYNLPEKFILSMARVDNPGMKYTKKWNPSKNAHTTLKAFLLCKNKIPHDIVFAGRNVKDYFLYMGFSEKDFERAHFINFVPFDEIQNIYSLADLIVVPSYYESFGFSLLGAIACGCPAVVSTEGACSEVVGEAGLYADPNSPEDFADKILKVLNDNKLWVELKEKSIAQASGFTWENTAKTFLDGIEKVMKGKLNNF